MMSPPRWSLAIACALAGAAACRGDLIFLKDGHVLQGTIRREETVDFDPVSREMFRMPKGFYLVDDGARRVYFSPTQVRIVEKLPAPAEERVLSHAGRLIANPRPLPPHLDVVAVGKWNLKRWEREYAFRSPDAPRVGVIQGLATLSPYYARVDAVTKFQWSSAYLTREWDPAEVLELLRASPSLQPKKEDTPLQLVAKRLRICDFLAQAGWYDRAERELGAVLKEFPDQKERVASARGMLDKLRVREEWERVKNWYQAGQYEAVRRRLETFPVEKSSDRIQADVREMRSRLQAAADLTEQAAQALDDTAKEAEGETGKTLAEAATVIKSELHPATADRLDAFLGQRRDAERRKARGMKPAMTPNQLLSLAVTGWLLGSPSAEAKPEVGLNLWKTRQMVLDYLREPLPGRRQKLLDDYLKQVTPRVDLDEVAQMIEALPPFEPAGNLTTETTTFQVNARRQPTTYALKLPPEYTHRRAYPVLVVLHASGEKPEQAIERYAPYAAERGYILAAPAWLRGVSDSYGYTEAEQVTVLDTLADLKRRFRVDCDRVFLTGLGESGRMAFDVGLSHPDCFAGVLPMAAGPTLYPRRYWRNAQYLPFYCVNGTRGADSYHALREQFNNWALRGYPSIWVEYKGRGTEFFSAELPYMFDWMRHQKRAFPLRQLGSDGAGSNFGNEFCTLRPEDNRFYWLSTSSIGTRNQVTPDRFNNMVDPATMTGRIEPSGNEVILTTRGLRDVTVWLGRNPAGQYMIDFEKPLTVRVGTQAYVVNRKVKPDLAVLLEDLYRRGDRRQLYLAKVEVTIR